MKYKEIEGYHVTLKRAMDSAGMQAELWKSVKVRHKDAVEHELREIRDRESRWMWAALIVVVTLMVIFVPKT